MRTPADNAGLRVGRLPGHVGLGSGTASGRRVAAAPRQSAVGDEQSARQPADEVRGAELRVERRRATASCRRRPSTPGSSRTVQTRQLHDNSRVSAINPRQSAQKLRQYRGDMTVN